MSLGCLRGVGAAKTQSPDPAGVGVEHLELDAGRMDDQLATDRHAARQRDDQTPEGVDVLPFLVAESAAEPLLQHLNGGAGVGVDGSVGSEHQIGFRIAIVFVLDFADDLLDHVLDGEQSVDAAEFVDHQGHVRSFRPHLEQQLQNLHRRRDEQDTPQYLRQPERRVLPPPREHVLDVDHADGVVESLPVNRQTRMPFLGHHLDDLGQRRPAFDSDDIGTGNHHVFRRPVAQIEDVGQQVAFVVVEGDLGLVAFPHQFVEGVAGRYFAVARPGKIAP